jgi:hypothetical protein
MSSVWSLESSGTASADRSRGWSSLKCLLSSAIYPETTKGLTALATFWRRERDDSNQLWLIRPLQGCAALRLGSKRSDGRVWSNRGGSYHLLSPSETIKGLLALSYFWRRDRDSYRQSRKLLYLYRFMTICFVLKVQLRPSKSRFRYWTFHSYVFFSSFLVSGFM